MLNFYYKTTGVDGLCYVRPFHTFIFSKGSATKTANRQFFYNMSSRSPTVVLQK